MTNARLSRTDYRALAGTAKTRVSKYRARGVRIDGTYFASQREARRYTELKIMTRAGEVSDLVLHPKYPLMVNGHLVATYCADFAYTTPSGQRIVEDVKAKKDEYGKSATITALYKIKRALMFALHGIEIRET